MRKPQFTPHDWYWHITAGKHRVDVPGTAVLEQVYSSSKGKFVPANDPDYLAWIAEIGDHTTPIDTIDDLKSVLAGRGLEFGKQFGGWQDT